MFNCSTLTLAAGWLPTVLTAAVTGGRPAVAAGFATFAAQQGTVFSVTSAAAAVRLELVAVIQNEATHPLAHLAEDGQNEKFTLLFRSEEPTKLEQNTYALRHSELGELDIFIVPTRVNGTTQNHYEAVFNRPAAKNLV